MKTDLLFKNFRKYNLSEQRVIQELTPNNFKKIKGWMDKASSKDYSFDKLFNGKKRVIIPFKTDSKEMKFNNSHLKKFIKAAVESDYSFNYQTGLISKEIEHEIPKGPKQGQKIKKKVEEKIGKFLQKLVELEEAGNTKELLKKLSILNTDPQSDYDVDSISFRIAFQAYEKEKQSSQELSILISRHPVDIFRMSDFENIQSCHSQGGDYFQCAYIEAKGNGLIAYLVKSGDLQKVDLDGEEIFADSERRIDGVKPIARLRLRKFQTPAGDLAVPEFKVYGQQVSGFQKAVEEWAKENQKMDAPKNLDDFKRYGGSYSDSDDSKIIGSFFGKEFPKKFYPQDPNEEENINYNTDREIDPEERDEADIISSNINDIINDFNNKTDDLINVSATVGASLLVSYSALVTIKLDDYDIHTLSKASKKIGDPADLLEIIKKFFHATWDGFPIPFRGVNIYLNKKTITVELARGINYWPDLKGFEKWMMQLYKKPVEDIKFELLDHLERMIDRLEKRFPEEGEPAKELTFEHKWKKYLREYVCQLKNSLEISRDKLPQIDQAHMGEFLKYLQNNNIKWFKTRMNVSEMLPVQSELNMDKVQTIQKQGFENLSNENPIIISKNDNHIADGHHRWYALKMIDQNASMPVYQIHAEIKTILQLMHNFDKSYREKIK